MRKRPLTMPAFFLLPVAAVVAGRRPSSTQKRAATQTPPNSARPCRHQTRRHAARRARHVAATPPAPAHAAPHVTSSAPRAPTAKCHVPARFKERVNVGHAAHARREKRWKVLLTCRLPQPCLPPACCPASRPAFHELFTITSRSSSRPACLFFFFFTHMHSTRTHTMPNAGKATSNGKKCTHKCPASLPVSPPNLSDREEGGMPKRGRDVFQNRSFSGGILPEREEGR